MQYSIIIPIYNEEKTLTRLLIELKPFSYNNEILIINDGSNDNSQEILENCSFIKLINLKENCGKGVAILEGIKLSKYKKIIITDGDLELKTRELKTLMTLRKKKKPFILGCRYKSTNNINSLWDLGNYILTKIFNLKNNSKIPDALCCAKSFYKGDIQINTLKSKRFDIDVEITSRLIRKLEPINITFLSYNRRNFSQGKKLRLIDGIIILKRILIT